MKRLMKGLMVVLVFSILLYPVSTAFAGKEDIPRTFSMPITPDGKEDIPRTFSLPTPDGKEDIPRTFSMPITPDGKEDIPRTFSLPGYVEIK